MNVKGGLTARAEGYVMLKVMQLLGDGRVMSSEERMELLHE